MLFFIRERCIQFLSEYVNWIIANISVNSRSCILVQDHSTLIVKYLVPETGSYFCCSWSDVSGLLVNSHPVGSHPGQDQSNYAGTGPGL